MEIRELSRQECTAILQRRRVGRLACCSRDRPYVVPLYFAYSDRSLYAFSMVGQKIEWLRQNPFATVLVEEDEDRAWRSVIVNGSYEELPDRIGHKVTRDHAWSLLSRHADWWRRQPRGRRRRAVGRARGRLRGRRAGRHRVPRRASRARSARRRSRTSAPTARRWPRRSPRCACSTARPARVRDLRAGRLRLRLPLQRVQARARALGGARGDASRSSASRALGAGPLRRAGAHARRRGRRAGAARRRARGGAGAAARQGHGARPRRPRHRLGGLVLHQPGARRGRVRGAASAAPPSAWAPTPPAGMARRRRPRQDVGRLADRARRLPPRPRRPRGHRDLDQAHAGADQPRRGHHGRAPRAGARDRRTACSDAFGVALVPEPVLVGHEW